MILNKPAKWGKKTNVHVTNEELSTMYNGLFRANMDTVKEHIPFAVEVIEGLGLSPELLSQYEVDIKIHMLMPDQYPCIPNWHCDNVPRGENNALDYNKAVLQSHTLVNCKEVVPMFLWVSGTPCTEFLANPLRMVDTPKSHDDVAAFIEGLVEERGRLDDKPLLQRIEPQQWYAMDQVCPHRGVKSDSFQWRVFIRLTHKDIAPARQVVSNIRRHSQVYLDANSFSW